MVVSPAEGESEFHADVEAKIRLPKPVPLNLAASLSKLEHDTEALASPSQRRWDTIRAHILPSPAGSGTFPSPQLPEIPQASTPPSSRPQTPKGSRFGQKKLFRQVVEQAREVAVDESRKLGEEIMKACWAVRFGDLPSRQKPEREGSQATMGSSFLPFIASATSLPMSSSASLISVPMTQKSNLRRPQSIQSLATNGRTAPSVTHITRALTYTTSSNRPLLLPHESHVLSALLVPFLGPYRGVQTASEQETAVETFEYAIRTWRAPSSEVSHPLKP